MGFVSGLYASLARPLARFCGVVIVGLLGCEGSEAPNADWMLPSSIGLDAGAVADVDAGPLSVATPPTSAPGPRGSGGITVSRGGDIHAGNSSADPGACAWSNIPAVPSSSQVLDAGTSIAGSLVACEYKLAVPVQMADLLHVKIDGERYALGSGWTLKDDMQTVVLREACDVLRDLRAHDLNITVECSGPAVL